MLRWTLVCLGGLACRAELPPPSGTPYNLLVVLTDDIGRDRTGAYGSDLPTPNIDALAESGVRFTHAYSNPTCSPSRASLLTGRQPSRTQVGRWIAMHGGRQGLGRSETTIPELLRTSGHGYTSSAVGKWHLHSAKTRSVAKAPNTIGGFDHFAGILGNPREAALTRRADDVADRGYFRWEKVVDGEASWSTTYLTTDTTDEAITSLQTLPEPWFLYVAYSAAHQPWHLPPETLQQTGHPEDAPNPDRMDAMVEAVDTEIGRLLAALSPEVRERTVIVYASDNGTEGTVARPPLEPDRAKGTTYDGGVRVPFVVSGPVVAEPGTTNDALVHLVDVLPTFADLVGVTPSAPLDGASLLPVLEDASVSRERVFTEGFYPNGPIRRSRDDAGEYVERMLRDREHKYVRWEGARTTSRP
ncbi:MAG: sulfatase-like hydrolase/transferase, partial [Myxococcota bacterium]